MRPPDEFAIDAGDGISGGNVTNLSDGTIFVMERE